MSSDREENDAKSDPAAPAAEEGSKKVDRRLLEILVCPLTRATLEFREESNELISRPARLAYPIVDGIPLMTAEAARSLTDDDLSDRR